MTRFGRSDDLKGAEFVGANLQGARFTECGLSGIVVRGSEIARAELDSPWLFEGESFLLVNGVDVLPLVDAELNRRFPGRELRHAVTPADLRAGWAALQRAWQAALDRAAAMPAGTVDISVAGEWSFAQTLRHLVMAIDTWLNKAILQRPDPYHPIGQPDGSFTADGADDSVFSTEVPAYAGVLEVWAGRQTMVRDFLAGVSPLELDAARRNPHAPEYQETVRSCLHTIIEEEWEHLRYALRDLDAIEAGRVGGSAS